MCNAQEGDVIPLKSEPHHHLTFHNEYVNVYAVEVAPQDSVYLHRHDADALGIMLDDTLITVRSPGKPDAQQKVLGGQIRLQRRGYVHSTSIDGKTNYRNVTVELLFPQEGARNLCAVVIPGEILNCQHASEDPNATGSIVEPRFQTDQTTVSMIRVLPHRSVTIKSKSDPELIIALDNSTKPSDTSKAGNLLRSGDFLWREPAAAAEVFKNDGDKEVRLVTFVLKLQAPAK